MDGTPRRRYPSGRKPVAIDSSTAATLMRRDSMRAGARATIAVKLEFAAGDLAPVPPGAPADNLLLASTETKDLVLTLPMETTPLDYGIGDTIGLVFVGEDGTETAIGNVIDVDPFFEDGSGGILPPAQWIAKLPLPAAARATQTEGKTYINIRYYYGLGGTDSGPLGQSYITDYTAPGGDEGLGPLRFADEVIAEGVTAAVLVSDDGGTTYYLPATVFSYEGHDKAGDTVTGIVNGAEETVDAIAAGTDQITVKFKRDFIETQETAAGATGKLTFSYKISDRAGNVSAPSEPVVLDVLLAGEVTNLEAPLVPQYTKGTPLGESDARAQITVNIPQVAGPLATDKIMVHWGDIEIGPVDVDPAADPMATALVKYAAVLDSWSNDTGGLSDTVQTVDVSYRLLRGNMVAGRPTADTAVEVNLYQGGNVDPDPGTPANEHLVPPTLTSASGETNEIPKGDLDKDAKVTVPYQYTDEDGNDVDVFVADDVLTVIYDGIELAPVDIAAAPTANIDVVLPTATIVARGSGIKALAYTIDRTFASGASNRSLSPPTDVSVKGNDLLPGKGTLPPCNVPKAENPPKPLAIGPCEAKDGGVDFEVPVYENQSVGDKITMTGKVYTRFIATGHATDTVPAPPRDLPTIEIEVAPGQEAAKTIFHYSEHDLMRRDIPGDGLSLHIHATYTVLGKLDDSETVTSAVQLINLDSRGGCPTR
ncbi:hypothetical protein SAMN02800694_3163 [Luteibacter sp. UNCMF331Sha3.1]|uniref:hypothetical protein n=1 Tax=Luteibacter sp. UNCMF331Sha3.1 TaxID=1502760 RepID=UPI0008C8D709|nr:hypothetical protein [Luteibacter sp. UNCMF331Sha3.1]SEN22934.1 hypothetical protein SAMN02800694_3163 [Luteibacter sp. UNCMF331Sha3.1]